MKGYMRATVLWLALLVLGLLAGLIVSVPQVAALEEMAAPSTVYVDDSYNATACTTDGHTWQVDCFNAIQDGVDAVAIGGTVVVGDGTYAEQLVVAQNGVTLKALVGDAAQLVTTSDDNDVLIEVKASGVTVENLALESPDRHVRWTGVAVHGQNATLKGLRINATCQGWPSYGVFAYNDGSGNASGLQVLDSSLGCGEEGIRLSSGTDPQNDVVIRGNKIFWWVAGIHGADSPLANLLVEQNHLVGWPDYSELAIALSSENHANSGRIVNNLIYDWRAGPYTISVGSSTATSQIDIINNTIVDNGQQAPGENGAQGAILIRGCQFTGKIRNNIIVNNRNYGLYGNFQANGSSCDASPSVDPRSAYGYQLGFVLNYNDLFDNAAGNYSGVKPGSAEISADPAFVDSPANNFRLQGISPCIDTGTNGGAPKVDLENLSRPVDGDGNLVADTDMGAYEHSTPVRTLEVIKALEPSTDPGRFNLQIDGFTESFDAADGGSTGRKQVSVGTHTVSETSGAGTVLTDYVSRIECRDKGGQGTLVASSDSVGPLEVVVGAEDYVVCTISNARKTGWLKVLKDLQPSADPGRFDLQIDSVTKKSAAGDGDSTGKRVVNTGLHTVGESATGGSGLADYILTIECRDKAGQGEIVASNADAALLEVAVGEGEFVVCTITNIRRGAITIVKDAKPSELTKFGFTGDVGSFDLTGSSSTSFTGLVPGSYQVSEKALAGWDLTSILCTDPDNGSTVDLATRTASIDLDNGEQISCTFQNVKPGQIVVEKQTQPDGSATPFTFAGNLNGSLKDGQSLSAVVKPGTYVIQETAVSGWDLTGVRCQDPSGDSWGNPSGGVATYKVAPGETVKCTFTNTQRGKISVAKQAYPQTTSELFAFSGDLSGTMGNGGELSKEVVPGTYWSSESLPPGWTLIAIQCDDPTDDSTGNLQTRRATFRISAGEMVQCAFINARPQSATIVKDAIPDNPQSFSFKGDLGKFSLLDSGTGTNAMTFTDLASGSYKVSEVLGDGWWLSGISCIDQDDGTTVDLGQARANIDLDDLEAVLCVFENSSADLEIRKTVDRTEVARGEILTYTVRFENLGGSPFLDVVVHDQVPDALQDVDYECSRPITPTGAVPYTWEVGDLAAGDSGVITISGRVKSQVQVGTTFTNTAVISSTVEDWGKENNVDSASVMVVNRAPLAVNDAFTVQRDVPFNSAPLSVLDNDRDWEGSALTAILVQGPAHGALILSGNGAFVYTPPVGFQGEDTFLYKAHDGLADSDVATVTMYVPRPVHLPLVMRAFSPQ